jgi:guanylate kinase
VTPRVVVLSAPSGGGKTTIAKRLKQEHPDTFDYSISATTRTARRGEREGEAYFFLTRDEFLRRREAGEFLESAEYAGQLYGTLRSEVERVLRSGKHVLLDIDVSGAQQVRTRYPFPASISLFVIPPSPRVLIERLRQRRTESEDELRTRVAIAVREVEAARDDAGNALVFDHVLINDDLETAVNDVMRIVADPGAAQRRSPETTSLLADYARELKIEAARLRPSAKRST